MKNLSIFYKYLANYLLIVFVMTLIIIIIFYSYTLNAYQNEVNTSNILKLERARDDIDSQLYSCHYIAEKIASNMYFSPFYMSNEIPSVDTFNELNKYIYNTDFFHDMLIVYNTPKINYYYSPKGTVAKQYFDNYYCFKGLSTREIDKMARELKTPVMLQTTGKDYPDQFKEFNILALPLSYMSKSYPSLILFVINTENMGQIIMNPFKNQNHLAMIIGKDQSVLFSKSNNSIDVSTTQIFDAITSHPDDKIIKINNSTTVYSVPSRYFDWSYTLTAKSSFNVIDLSGFRQAFITGLCLLLFFGILLSYSFAFKSYTPIKKLLERILKAPLGVPDDSLRKRRNEFTLIEQVFNRINNENEALLKDVKITSSSGKNLLISLLSGDYISMEGTALRTLFGIPTNKNTFILILFTLDNYQWFCSNYDSVRQKEIIGEILRIIKDSLSINVQVFCSQIMTQNYFAAVCALEENSTQAKTEVFNAVKQIQAFVITQCGLSVTSTMSRFFYNLHDAPEILYSAVYASNYRFVCGLNSIIDMENISYSGASVDMEFYNDFFSFYKDLKLGDYDRTMGFISRMMEHLREKYTPNTFKITYINILSCLKKANDDKNNNNDLSRQLEEYLNYTPETLDETANILVKCVDCLFTQMRMGRESKNLLLKKVVLEFIEKEYSNDNLSLNMIADHFCVSPSYLSRYFKDQIGENLTIYIDNIRIEKAKNLLNETNLPVKEIVKSVGYNDINNFNRKFKIKEGTTPLGYRKRNQSALSGNGKVSAY